MNNIIFFLLVLTFGFQTYGQVEFNSKFKVIPPATTKPKKELPQKNEKEKSILPKLETPKIITPNIFKETNIYGKKNIPNNDFKIGVVENNFSMIVENKFPHKMGDVYKEKMTADLGKSLIREGLKEDSSFLDRENRDLGEFRTKSELLIMHYRDYMQIDGDVINIYINDKLFKSQMYLFSQLQNIKLPLSKGINIIELVVASTGTYGGNTGEIHAIDGLGTKLKDEYWNNLALGTKIKLLVIKE